MDSVDTHFFQERLPQEGVSQRLIIGSKFDSALIDEARKFDGDLQQARDETKKVLLDQAKDALRRLSEDDVAGEPEQIVFLSAMCSKLSTTPYDEWNEQERGIFDRLRAAYPDWLDAADRAKGAINDETKMTLASVGNEDEIADHLKNLRRCKEHVKSASNLQTVAAKREAASTEVEELVENLRAYRKKVNNVKAEQVEKQMKAVAGLAARLGVMVGDEWRVRVQKEVEDLAEYRRELRAEAKKVREELEGEVESKLKTKTVKKKGFGSACARFFGAGGYEDKTYEAQVLNTSAVNKAIENIAVYVNDRFDEISDDMFDVQFVRDAHTQLKDIIADELSSDVADEYDVDMVQAVLRDAITKLADNARTELKKGPDFEVDGLVLRDDVVLEKKRRLQQACAKGERPFALPSTTLWGGLTRWVLS